MKRVKTEKRKIWPAKKLTTKVLNAKSKVESMLLSESIKKSTPPQDKRREVSIEIWESTNPAVGLRVAEVSFVDRPKNGQVTGMSGASFMQSDQGAESVCFLCERLILELSFPDPAFNDTEDLKLRLLAAVFGKTSA